MPSVELHIQNQRGLHARAAAKFVKLVSQYDAAVLVRRLEHEVIGTSIMGLMLLSANKGSTISVTATGVQAEDVLSALEDLINSRFGEE